MQLTPQVIRNADAYLNPANERELSLRGLKLKTIENLGVTKVKEGAERRKRVRISNQQTTTETKTHKQ